MTQGLLAIDPGNCTGWAYFSQGALFLAGVTEVDAKDCVPSQILHNAPHHWPHTIAMLIEVPQVYRPGLSKGDPNDLIKVAIQVGRWVERAKTSPVEMVKPATWKGQVPKGIHHARAMRVLSADEAKQLPPLPKTKGHNMMDAVALGLWKLGRLR